jgi:hypothetical protein
MICYEIKNFSCIEENSLIENSLFLEAINIPKQKLGLDDMAKKEISGD